MKEFILPINFSDKIKQPYFYERLYYSILEDGIDLNYGDFNSKILKNGTVKVLKSLGIYKVTGARDNKKVFIHPKLELIINSTIADNSTISKTIMDLHSGKFISIQNFSNLELSGFNKLPAVDLFNSEVGFGTYIIHNPINKLFKIGKTKNISNRLIQLRNEFGLELSLVAFKGVDKEMEMHERFKERRMFGEWFDFNFDEILDIAQTFEFNLQTKNN